MREKAEELKALVQEKFSVAQRQVETAKTNVASTYDKTRSEIHTKVDEATASLNAKKEQAERAKARFETNVGVKVDKIRTKIAAKKEERAIKKAFAKVDHADEYADACIDNAVAAIAEAEVAYLLAVEARVEEWESAF